MLNTFKIGDRVVCVDNYRNISINLIYVITEIRNSGLIVVSNDEKLFGPFYSYRFTSLKNVRKEKLKNLNKCQ